MQLLKNVNILKGQWQIICDILLTEKLRNEHHTMKANLNGTAKLYCKILGLLLYKNILNCLFKSLDSF